MWPTIAIAGGCWLKDAVTGDDSGREEGAQVYEVLSTPHAAWSRDGNSGVAAPRRARPRVVVGIGH